MTELVLEDKERFVVYITAGEEEKTVSFTDFQESAYLYV